jgi:hypothetical protein
MQVKSQWENEKLIMLNNKASIEDGNCMISCYLLHVLETVIFIDTEFSRAFYNIQYKYNISVKQ